MRIASTLHEGNRTADIEVAKHGRSTAAVTASHAGKVLKISEDGPISFHEAGHRIWEL